MKKLFAAKKNILLFTAALAVLFLLLALTAGFGADEETAGKTVLACYLPYGTDTSSVDHAVLTGQVREALGVRADVSVTANFTDGYTNVLVTLPAGVTPDEKALVSMFQKEYPDFQIESFTRYELDAPRTNGEIWAVMGHVAFFGLLLFAGYDLLTAKSLKRTAVASAVFAASVSLTMVLLIAARIPFGRRILAAEVSCLLASGLFTVWHLGSYSLLTKNRKSVPADASQRADAANWNVTLCGAVLALLALTGLAAGGLLTGASGSLQLAVSLTLPVLVSALLSQLMSVRLFEE